MIDALAALRAGARALLEARGEAALAAMVARADLEIAGPPERWSMGSREVTAQRLALVVDAPELTALTADPRALAAVNDAFASAARTPETELAELTLVLRLPGIARGWRHVYREAPPGAAPERADPDAVLGGAAALLEALGDARGAAMLRRARLETAAISGGGAAALVRCVVRLEPADRAALDRDADRAERLRRAVRDAATRAAETVTTVELATALREAAVIDTAEGRLASALAARGAAVVTVSRSDGEVVLAVVAEGEVRLTTITPARAGEPRWRLEQVQAITVSAEQIANAELAAGIAALVCGDGELE